MLRFIGFCVVATFFCYGVASACRDYKVTAKTPHDAR